MNDQPLEHPLPEPQANAGGPELPNWNATSPPPKAIRDDIYVLPGGLVTTPEDWGHEPNFELDLTDSAFEVAIEQLATDLPVLVQQQDDGIEHGDLSHEDLKEVLRETLREQQESGEQVPLSVDVARLVSRMRTDAGTVWADAERRHGAWRDRVAPTLPALNSDGSVVSSATLAKSAGIGLAVLVFFLLLTTWKVAFVWTWIAVALYLLAPVWRPKLRTGLQQLKTQWESMSRPPQE